jgi:hypothetical protein
MLYPISVISLEDHSDIFRRVSLCDKIFDMQLGDLESTLLSQLRFLFSLPVYALSFHSQLIDMQDILLRYSRRQKLN